MLRESSLDEVDILHIADSFELNSQSATEDSEKFSDPETNDREDDACKPANIFGNSWPFIDPAQIKRTTNTKPPVRRRKRKTRRKKKTWSMRRQRKARPRIDDATADLPAKRDTSSRKSKRENFTVSHDRSARLSARANSSLTRSRVFVGDERLPESYRSTGEDATADDDDEEEVISQTTSETSSADEIAHVDYSDSEYSRFRSSSHAKEESQNRTELSEYPDYFMNVLRIDNSTENNHFDTWEDVTTVPDTSRDNARISKLAKITERRASRKVLDKSASRRIGRASSRKKELELKDSEDRSEVAKKRRNRLIGREQKKIFNSTTYNHNNRRRSSHDLEENSSRRKSRGDVAVGTRDVAKEITVQKCSDCKAQRRSYNFTNVACPCKRKTKDMATAIMRDIQECINTKIAKDLKIIKISETEKDMLSNSKDLSRDISMEYDFMEYNLDEDDDLDWDFPSQETIISKQSFDLVERREAMNVEELSMSFNNRARRRKKRYRYSIDCKFDEKIETAYRSVFHDCVDFDTPRSRSSLKINMEESWKSENSSDNDDDEIHSSWRRSTLESSTEECGNEVDGALLLAQKIVNDDSTKDEKFDEEYEALNNTCYKYREVSNSTARDNSLYDSDVDLENIEFINQRDEAKDIITYRNKNRTIKRSTSDCSLVKDEDDDSIGVSKI